MFDLCELFSCALSLNGKWLPSSAGALNAMRRFMFLNSFSTRVLILLVIISDLSFVYGSERYFILKSLLVISFGVVSKELKP